jgi:hypothetical protein
MAATPDDLFALFDQLGLREVTGLLGQVVNPSRAERDSRRSVKLTPFAPNLIMPFDRSPSFLLYPCDPDRSSLPLPIGSSHMQVRRSGKSAATANVDGIGRASVGALSSDAA